MGFMISERTQPINYYDKRCNRDRRQEGNLPPAFAQVAGLT